MVSSPQPPSHYTLIVQSTLDSPMSPDAHKSLCLIPHSDDVRPSAIVHHVFHHVGRQQSEVVGNLANLLQVRQVHTLGLKIAREWKSELS